MEIIPHSGFSFLSIIKALPGLFFLLGIAYLLSNDKKNIPWKTVIIAILTQLLIGICILKVPVIKLIFENIGQIFLAVIDSTINGTSFLFGSLININSEYIFALNVLPVIIFFSALSSMLYYYGVIQKVVGFFGWCLRNIVKISGAESLSLTGNIFLGQTEAPLLIKGYLEKMNYSEIYTVMIGGMATVAGSVLAGYVSFLGGDDPIERLNVTTNLIAASVMAAPGAVAIAKIIVPNPNKTLNKDISIEKDKKIGNVLDAITEGTIQGMKLAFNVGAMLLVFIALLGLLNKILFFLGDITQLNLIIENNTTYSDLSLEFLLGYLFAPIMWIIGIAKEDITLMGQLLGIKIAANEFLSYLYLSDLKNVSEAVHLTYQKSILMATFMLCGFANFQSIGIQIGGIGYLAPNQKKLISSYGLKAVIGGTLVSLISATFAGIILG
ncbi:MAG: nucleoside transporter C-terminal domain-containing protein [Flavobacteriaceae bacterium]|nr:nucleoside transporter C-terminal domain-containing protein [Flavobacteriaceae bacterium]